MRQAVLSCKGNGRALAGVDEVSYAWQVAVENTEGWGCTTSSQKLGLLLHPSMLAHNNSSSCATGNETAVQPRNTVCSADVK